MSGNPLMLLFLYILGVVLRKMVLSVNEFATIPILFPGSLFFASGGREVKSPGNEVGILHSYSLLTTMLFKGTEKLQG